MKIWVSLTTSPTRIWKIKPTLESLIAQTIKPEKIVINIPNVFSRTQETYEIPEFLKDMSGVEIFRCSEDYGPGTKLIPTLHRISIDDDVWIATCDDDIQYLPYTLETYVRSAGVFHERPAMSLSGFSFNQRDEIVPTMKVSVVDVIEGYGMAIYHRSHFKKSFFSYVENCLKDKATRVSDDLYVSNYLALMGVPRLQTGAPWCSRQRMWQMGCILDHGNQDDALHKQCSEGNKRYSKTRRYLKSKGLLAKDLDFKSPQ